MEDQCKRWTPSLIAELDREQGSAARGAISEGLSRPAHILGGWSPSTPRFPNTHWEIVKIHAFSLIFHENRSNLMENRGFSRFPKVSWEIWVSIQTTPPQICAGLVLAQLEPRWQSGRSMFVLSMFSPGNTDMALGAAEKLVFSCIHACFGYLSVYSIACLSETRSPRLLRLQKKALDDDLELQQQRQLEMRTMRHARDATEPVRLASPLPEGAKQSRTMTNYVLSGFQSVLGSSILEYSS